VLFVGRLAEKKGCEYALRAVKLAQRSRPATKLVVIGDGELRERLQRLNSDLSVGAQFLGEQTSDTVRAWLRRASIFCAPSVTARSGDTEGLPTVLCEAQASGTPVVSTFHGGIPEIVRHKETGLLSPERNPESLANDILQLLSCDELRHKFGTNSRSFVMRNFDLRTQTRELERLYSSVIFQAAAERNPKLRLQHAS
jgi:glycosyltransferase involved in cell wall biosynthesis